MQLSDLRTPSVLVDKPRFERNLDRMQAAASAKGIRLRPHAKTHKSPELARLQISRGAAGVCCAKLGEAEVFPDAGIEDIRLPYPINPVNARRVLQLLDKTRLSFIVDDLDVARDWSDEMRAAGRDVDVLVKVDVGFHRCGIDPQPDRALPFIKTIATLGGLSLKGLLSHAGHAYHAASETALQQIARDEARTLHELATAAREQGVEIDELSAGATPTARYSLQQEWLTEYRAGNYVYFDRTQVGLGAATWNDCALTVLARVVSKPAPDRLILDSGSKTLAADGARGFVAMSGHGAVFRDVSLAAGATPDGSLLVERLSEEHATVRVVSGQTPLQPGDLVRLVPNHSCVVSNLVDNAWLCEGVEVVGPMPIIARGCIT